MGRARSPARGAVRPGAPLAREKAPMTMKHGERQVAPTLEGIRADHVARYQFAAQLLKKPTRVIDFACGVGYGSKILADAGHFVYGYDRDPEAIAYAREHY